MSTKVKGVYFDNHMKRWIGRLQYKGITHRKGFLKKEDAIKHRKDLEEMYIPKQVSVNDSKGDVGAQGVKGVIQAVVAEPTLSRGKRADLVIIDEYSKLVSEDITRAVDALIKVYERRPKNFCMVNESFDYIYTSGIQGFMKRNTKTGNTESGMFNKDSIRFRLIYNDSATIVILDDGTKGVAICGEDDTFSRKAGLEYAFGRAYGQYLVNKYKK